MVCLPFLFCLLLISLCKCDDQLTQAKQLHPGDKLVSKSGVFALGFFSPATSKKSLFLGIWYHNISERTYVWVANRDNPITTPSSVMLTISNNSNLVLSDSKNQSLWTTTNSIVYGGDRAYATLLDSGNLVLRLPNDTTIWQSFDHPTDTILMNMKFLVRYKAQVAGRLVAWRGPDDPSTGEFSCSAGPSSDVQFFTWNGTMPYYRFIGINRVWVSGIVYKNNFIYESILNTGDEIYLMFTTPDGSPYVRLTLDYMGTLKFLGWNSSLSSWKVLFQRPEVNCDKYAMCGPFSYCDTTSAIPRCQCLDGFEPDSTNSSRGCQRKQQLRCRDGDDHFVTIPGMKVPDMSLHVQSRSFDECTAECNRNCSCTAYAYGNLTGDDQARCLLWTGDLVDMRMASIGQNLYIRLADSTGYTPEDNKKNRYLVKVVVPIIACLVSLVILTCIYLVRKWQSKGKHRNNENQNRAVLGRFKTSHELYEQNLEFPCINFEDMATATNNFSDSNMLGKGGFGNVYKGILEDGKEVAIKRLSTGSTQGVEHFTNEVVLIAKLQHKNLVRLLGCCIHGDERLLIYEYLPNKSLDAFIFDPASKYILDWPTRFKIIKGVARGLVYLHQDSRLTIIHRDLKSSNILLDVDMSPKISDFGMARIFGGNQQEANTNRVVGTYGYMSPEYVLGGAFSVKSDTYSFGVLLLEIVSGLKISSSKLTPNFFSLTTY
ncbi:hypothetical protein E2562_004349, partial [Oryza meyeriana var. granulata]